MSRIVFIEEKEKQKIQLVHIYVNSALWPLTFENCLQLAMPASHHKSFKIFSAAAEQQEKERTETEP